MAVQFVNAAEAMARLAEFDTIIDARSPAEYAEDRLPAAVNWPVLDDEERARVGTIYKQVSAFEARKVGAALVSRNIAAHLEREMPGRPKHWKPLVYCWRGGKRSGSLALVLDQIGFRTCVLEGGYKAFRAQVREDLDRLPARLDLRVVCGRTGSGKTRLLQALRAAGAQVLDLEGLARHRGSVLGVLPGQPQPSQKHFETRIWHELRSFDPARPVYVESESRKVGNLRVPDVLMERMRRDSECIRVELPDESRVQLLLEDYDFFLRDVDLFERQLECLVELRGRAVVDRWKALARGGEMAQVCLELMHTHYDPVYLKSMQRNFAHFEQARVVQPRTGDPAELARVAAELLAGENTALTA